MYATIQKWGNSHGVRLPKALLERLDFWENDRVELILNGDSLTIKKAAPGHRTLEQRLTAFYGVPVEEIPRMENRELSWGEGRGEEAW